MSVPQVEQLDDDAAKAARRPIATAIDAFNDEASGISDPSRLLAVTIRDPESGEITGGLYGVSYYGWLFIELLIIPERYRGQRLGTRLMQQAEAAASDRGCLGVWLDTFSFQARGFYEKLGYEVFGEIADFPPGKSRFWLRKRLV